MPRLSMIALGLALHCCAADTIWVELPQESWSSMIVKVGDGEQASFYAFDGETVPRLGSELSNPSLEVLLFDVPLESLDLAEGRLETSPVRPWVELPSPKAVYFSPDTQEAPLALATMSSDLASLHFVPARRESDCPDLGTKVSVACAAAGCSPRLSQSGCSFEIDATESTCVVSSMVGFFGRSSRLYTTELSTKKACQEVDAPEWAERSVICDRPESPLECRVTFSAIPQQPFASVESVQVIDPSRLKTDTRGGYLNSLAVTPKLVAVGTAGGDQTLWADCAEGLRSELVLVDRISLEIVSTSTAPSCIRQLIPDPIDGGFIIISGSTSTWAAKVDRSGNIAEPIRLEGPWAPDDTRVLSAWTDGVQILLGLDEGINRLEGRAFVVRMSVRDLSISQISQPMPPAASYIAKTKDGLAVLNDARDELLLLNEDDFSVVGTIGDLSAVGGNYLPEILYHEATDTVLVSRASGTPAVLITDRSTVRARAYDHLERLIPFSLTPWIDPDLALVTLHGNGEDAPLGAHLGLVDPRSGHILPQTVRLEGEGRLELAVPDPENADIWIAQPNDAKLYRARPEAPY